MSEVKELIRTESDGTISFGDYSLAQKAKKSDFEHAGDLYKVKTYADITRLERNGMLVYESVPGTAVHNFEVTGEGVAFETEGKEDVQVTLGLEDDAEYAVCVNNADVGVMQTKMGGKLVLSIEIGEAGSVPVKVIKK